MTALRVVVTGVGVVSPIGIGRNTFWENLIAGRSGVDFLTAFPSEGLPCKLAAEVRDLDPSLYVKHKKLLKVMSRDIELGVAAAALAMEDSSLEQGEVDPERFGVEFGAGHISIIPDELKEAAASCLDELDHFEFGRFNHDSLSEICPLWLLKHLPNMPACHVAIEHDARGPNNTITCRESSALLALDEAVRTIQRGAADVMIVGASGSNVHPVDMTRLSLLDELCRRTEDPTRACRPFDKNRDGSIPGEGSAVFIIEEYTHARARGAEIYAEILGVAGGADGAGYRNGSGGDGIVRAVNSALRKADLPADQVGHINAHGKSTQWDDFIEARAYNRIFGSYIEKIPVTALKPYFGSCDAGAGAVELAGSLLALKHGVVPMTLNYETPDPECRVNVIHREPWTIRNRTAVSVNRTDVGQSAALVMRAI